jgi:hypothetical protein
MPQIESLVQTTAAHGATRVDLLPEWGGDPMSRSPVGPTFFRCGLLDNLAWALLSRVSDFVSCPSLRSVSYPVSPWDP